MSNVSVATITIRNRIRRRQLCYRDSWTRHEPAFVACSASCIVFFVPLLSTAPSILSRISTTFHLLRFLLLHRSATRCCCPYPGNLAKRAAPTYTPSLLLHQMFSPHFVSLFSFVTRPPASRSSYKIMLLYRCSPPSPETGILHSDPLLVSAIPRIHADTASSSFAFSTNTVRIPGARADYLCHHLSLDDNDDDDDDDDKLVDTRDHLIPRRILTRWYEVRGTDISRTGGAKSSRCARWLGDRTTSSSERNYDRWYTITRGHVTRSTSRRRRLAVDWDSGREKGEADRSEACARIEPRG